MEMPRSDDFCLGALDLTENLPDAEKNCSGCKKAFLLVR